jgi:hypothetical protein
MATAPALRWTALYVLLPVLRSGKTKTVARPATGAARELGRRHADVDGGVVLDRALDGECRRALPHHSVAARLSSS